MKVLMAAEPDSEEDRRPASPLRIAVPTFGILTDVVAPVMERGLVSREEIIEMFRDRLRPTTKPDRRPAIDEASQAAIARRLRQALYPKD